jgi:exopolysaccharide biosynthesis polyprenyl glycosylphosphotransferase
VTAESVSVRADNLQIGRAAEQAPVIPRRTWRRRYVTTLVVGDAISALAVGLAAVAVNAGHGTAELRQQWLFALVPLWLTACFVGRAYEERFLVDGTAEYRKVLSAGVHAIALAAVLSFAFQLNVSRAWVGLVLPTTVALSLLVRIVARRSLARRRVHSGEARNRVVVVGRSDSAAQLMARMTDDPRKAWDVVAGCVEGVDRVGDTVTAVRTCQADTVAVATDSGLSPSELRRLGWELHALGVDLVVSTDLVEVAGPRIHVRAVDGLPLLHVSTPEFHGWRRLVKTCMDRGIAILALIALSPLLFACAIAVRLDSPGPAIFRQRRVGRDGREFTLWKFRSMVVDAEKLLIDLREHNEHDGVLFKIKDDPRVTSVGSRLRKWSLDELPQLVNVARGEMSLVGPRPPLPHEVMQYGTDVKRRLLVKPGLTGLWQVSGRSNLSWDQTVRLDLSYVENWSVTLDLLILCRTVGAVMKRTGSY